MKLKKTFICSILIFFSSLLSSQNFELNSFAGDLFFPVFGATAEGSLKTESNYFSKLSASGGFLGAKPDLSKFEGKFYSGYAEIKIGLKKLDFSAGAFGVNIPGKTKILNGKPRFILENGDFAGFYTSVNYCFSKSIKLSSELFAGKGGFDWGDLYYFFGHPENIKFVFEKTEFLLPYGFDFSFFGGKIKAKIQADNTEIKEKLGTGSGNFIGLKAEKDILGSETKIDFRHFLSIKLFYCYAEIFGSVLATSEPQDSFFFPYERIYGHLNDKFYVAGLGFSYEYKRSSLKVRLDTDYFHCFANEPDANYSYKYKKNIFFDGSAASKDFDFADFTNCGFFAGKLSVSYNAKTILKLKRVEPELRLSRLFVLPLLTDTAKNGLKTKLSSSANSSLGLSSSKNLQKIKTILLSGTILSLKIKY